MTTDHNLTYEQIMAMPTADLDKLDPTKLLNAQAPANDQSDANEDDQQDNNTDNEDDSASENDSADQQEDDEGNPDQGANPDDYSGSDGEEDDTGAKDDEKNPDQKADEKTDDPAIKKEDFDKYKNFFEQVTAEFKANGKAYSIDSAADVITLMQMGLNYNTKMARIKPFLGIIDVLKEHGLTEADKLGYLIDLHNKKPEAIAKLIQDSGLEAYELDDEKAKTYQPTQPDISPNAAELRAISEEHANDPNYAVVVNDILHWDDASKKMLGDDPRLIRMLIAHKRDGYYDQIMAHVNRERAVGRVVGNILQHYDAAGTQLFSQPNQDAAQNIVAQTSDTAVGNQGKSNANNAASDARKRAASMSRPRSAATTGKQSKLTADDIFSMSAEDFNKIDPKFLK